MALNYLYCESCSGAENTVAVTYDDTQGCVTVFDGWNGGEYQYYSTQTVRVTIPSAITCDLTVRIQQYLEVTGNFNNYNETTYFNIVIPAGQTQGYVENKTCQNNITGDQYYSYDTYTYSLASQTIIPSCEQPSGCNLEITGNTVTSPSLLGSSDGSITVYISGQTGSSFTFRLNGGTPQSSPTFNSLAAGTYQVRVDEGSCFYSVEIVIPNGAFSTSPFTVNEPPSIVASENPIMLTLRTAVFDGTNLETRSSFTVNSGIGSGYRMVFNLTSPVEYTVTFTAKSFPNRANYFLSSTLTDAQGNFIKNNTTTEIANSLAQVFENDIVISSNYYVNVSSNVVTLVAKTASSRFNIDSSNVTRYTPANVVTTTGVTITLVQSGTDFYEGDILDNYRLFAEVHGKNSDIQYGSTLAPTQFNRLTELQLPYQKSNFMKFDFSQICKSFVFTPKPDYEFSGFTTITSYMQPFYFKYGEIYPLVANTNTSIKRLKDSTDYIWVCNAALDYERANVMTGYTGTTISGYLRNVPYLTNAPNPKPSTRQQRELLYFIVPKDLNQGVLSVKGDIVFWDGSTLPIQSFITISTGSTNFGGAFVINVSFEVLGLDVIESTYNKLIKQINIALYSGAGTSRNVTAVKSYRYDLEEKTNRVGLSWLNKLGTFDSFDFVGQSEESVDRTAKSYTLARDINFNGSVNKGFKYNTSYDVAITKKLRVNSGWIDSDTFNWLSEIIGSNEIYIYSSEEDNYVNVVGYKYTKSSNDTLYNLELELIETAAENNVSV